MSGIVEGEEPGESGIVIEAFVAEGPVDVAEIDVEMFVDRLRFMGIDEALIEEADRRLRAEPVDGMRWLKERLEELEPPREPPTCSCGEPLVDVAWRGRATIRCANCGSRWGVEVIDDETESIWSITAPTKNG